MPGDHSVQQGDDAIAALSDDSADSSAAAATLRRHRRAAEVLEGKRAMDWTDWALAIPESQTLTAEGRRVAGWAVETLRHILQEDFPSRAQIAAAQGTQGAHPIFWHNLWPMNDVPWVYANLFQLAAQFQLFGADIAANRFGKVCQALRHNLDPTAWVSALLQLEVASLGLSAGWTIQFEPPIGRNPRTGSRRQADVGLFGPASGARMGAPSLVVETTTMKRSHDEQRALAYFTMLSRRLLEIEATYNVRLAGAFGAPPTSETPVEPEQLEAWMVAIEAAARATAQDGAPRQVMGVDGQAESGGPGGPASPDSPGGPRGASLRIFSATSFHDPEPLEITGPLLEARPVNRLVARLHDKDQQAAFSPSPVWVRLDEYAGLWEATRLQGQPLDDLLAMLGPILQHHLAQFPHLAGVIVAPAVLWNASEPGGATHAEWTSQGCVAVRSPYMLKVGVHSEEAW